MENITIPSNYSASGIIDITNNVIKIADGTQGDIIHGGASGVFTTLGAGTSGDRLETKGVSTNPLWSSSSETLSNPIYISAFDYDSVIAGTWAISVNAGGIRNANFQNSSTALNDEIRYKLWLPKGTYTMHIIGYTTTTLAIAHYQLDETEFGTLDWYAGSGTWNVYKSIANINNTTSSLKNFDIKAGSKNASATAYLILFMEIWFVRTGDST